MEEGLVASGRFVWIETRGRRTGEPRAVTVGYVEDDAGPPGTIRVAAGADALMLGSPLARAEEAPGRGTNWGMAAPSPTLPRGTRIKVGTVGALERILFGPAHVTDGSENLVGALRQSMAALGAQTVREMQRVEMVYAPSTQTEGKSWQRAR